MDSLSEHARVWFMGVCREHEGSLYVLKDDLITGLLNSFASDNTSNADALDPLDICQAVEELFPQYSVYAEELGGNVVHADAFCEDYGLAAQLVGRLQPNLQSDGDFVETTVVAYPYDGKDSDVIGVAEPLADVFVTAAQYSRVASACAVSANVEKSAYRCTRALAVATATSPEANVRSVKCVRNMLVHTLHWQESSIRVLADAPTYTSPSADGIIDALLWLVEQVAPGDVLLLYYFGIGAAEYGMTRDMLSEVLLRKLPLESRLIIINDCGSSLSIPLRFEWSDAGWITVKSYDPFVADIEVFEWIEHRTKGQTKQDFQFTSSLSSIIASYPSVTLSELMHSEAFSHSAGAFAASTSKRIPLDRIAFPLNS